jgi:hypothetical protein
MDNEEGKKAMDMERKKVKEVKYQTCVNPNAFFACQSPSTASGHHVISHPVEGFFSMRPQ